MKRSLEVLIESDGESIVPPQILRVRDTTLAVFDEGDGSTASRLASCMSELGAMRVDTDTEPEAKANLQAIRIVIRAPRPTAGARKRAAALEAAADVVLGSARPAFAKRLVEALLGDR